MRHLRSMGMLLAAALAGCAQGSPAASPRGPSGPSAFRVLQVVKPLTTYADSFNTFGNTQYGAYRATDGNPDTEWGSRDGSREARLVMDFGQPTTFTGLRIKAQPTQGSRYQIEVADQDLEGAYRPISGQISTGDWNFHDVAITGATARYMRIHWYKEGAPLRHWSVFEVIPYGTGGGTTQPPPPGGGLAPWTGQLTWLDKTFDRVNHGGTTQDGGLDGRFQLTLNLPAAATIKGILLTDTDPNGNPGGQAWNTAPSGNWFLGVYQNGAALQSAQAPTLGTLSGLVTLELFASDSGYFNAGQNFAATVDFTDGRRITARGRI